VIKRILLAGYAATALTSGTIPASSKLDNGKLDITVIIHRWLGRVFWLEL
jgi:hypothetical protein